MMRLATLFCMLLSCNSTSLLPIVIHFCGYQGLCCTKGWNASALGYNSHHRNTVESDVTVVIKHLSEFRAELLASVVQSSSYPH